MDYFTLSVSFAVGPLAIVFSAVCPGVLANSVLFVQLILSFVFSSVLPLVLAATMHLVVEPVALVSPAI